jgi:predicted histone-like DNA-binding protein
MLWKLIDGDSVRFGDIGTFSIAVTSDGFENPEDITPDKVRATKIVFTPTKKFNKLLLEMKFTNYDKRLRKALGKRYSK